MRRFTLGPLLTIARSIAVARASSSAVILTAAAAERRIARRGAGCRRRFLLRLGVRDGKRQPDRHGRLDPQRLCLAR